MSRTLLVLVGAALHTSAFLLSRAGPRAPPAALLVSPRARLVVAKQDGAADSAPLTSYTEAEARGFELYSAGEYERAIRMFELVRGQRVSTRKAVCPAWDACCPRCR